MELELHRDVDLDVDIDEAWRMVADPRRLADWFADSVDVPIEEGAAGTILEDGVARTVHVDRVEDGRRLAFTWWEADGGDVSRVTFDIERTESGSRLRITERIDLGRRASVNPADATLDLNLRWESRVCALWACTVVAALVA